MDVRHIDLIVLDVMMPKMDGYKFTEHLRSCESMVPILMVTTKQLHEFLPFRVLLPR
ncbi:MAG: response regulator [Acutalibacteraceae bacterium]